MVYVFAESNLIDGPVRPFCNDGLHLYKGERSFRKQTNIYACRHQSRAKFDDGQCILAEIESNRMSQ